MIVSHVEKNPEVWTTLGKMPHGSVGITKEGKYYFRTGYSIPCLNSHGQSYSCDNQMILLHNDVAVRILPKGTKITLEVE